MLGGGEVVEGDVDGGSDGGDVLVGGSVGWRWEEDVDGERSVVVSGYELA